MILHLLKHTRTDSSLLVMLLLFLPTFVHSGDLYFSFTQSVPLIPMSMCAFVLNDINDFERDKVNHPDRILQKGLITVRAATILYFALLAITLILIKLYMPLRTVFYYLFLLILFLNYNYVVDEFPKLKNLYIGLTATVPFVILHYLNESLHIALLPVSVFLFIVGRELLMDVEDILGDGNTLAKQLGDKYASTIALGLQLLAIVALAVLVNNVLQLTALLLVAGMFTLVLRHWNRKETRKRMLALMKLQMALGLAFLL